MKIDYCTLEVGADVPFKEGRLFIHQPTIYEIGMMGEEKFFKALQFLDVTKELLEAVDNIDLSDFSNFDILMSMIRNSYENDENQKESFYLLMNLLFPQNELSITDTQIILGDGYLDNSNFEEFKQYIKEIFCIGTKADSGYNPAEGSMSARIMKKLNERKKKLAELKGEDENEGSLFGRIINILAVGERKSKIDLRQYTVYQLQEEYERFNLKEYHDYVNRARLVGAKDLKEPEDWMKVIHP